MYKVKVNEADSWLWQWSAKNSFSTKEMYDLIVEASPEDDVVHFPWRKLCWKVIPSKISAFSLKAIRERPPTKDNLMKRGFSNGLGTGLCLMCLSPLKSSNHVLFSCLVALLVWLDISL